MPRPVGKTKKSDWMAAYINRVRWAREEMHPPRTAREIARLLEDLVGIPVDPDTYGRYETRTPLPVELLLPLCRLTGAKVEDILNYDKHSVERDKDVGARITPKGKKARTAASRPPPMRPTGTG